MNGMNNGWNGYNNQNNSFNQNNFQNQQNMNYQGQPVVNNTNDSSPKKNNNLVNIILLLLVVGLAGFIIYDKVIKKEEAKESGQQETNNGTEEKLDSNTKVFYDTLTNQKYYLVVESAKSDGDIYDKTTHKILDENKNNFAVIPELSTSHIWKIGKKSLLGDEEKVSTTAVLKGNKIYSLDNDPDDSCSFVKYEIYIENGVLKKEIIDRYSDADMGISIEVSGEHC